MNFFKPKIMGVLNITPDSFSDGGNFLDPKNAIQRIHEMIQEKADIIDVGGESSRPDSKSVPLTEEINRVKPVIDYIFKNKLFLKTAFSIDTTKAEVANYALAKGFTIVNDITALRSDKNMIKTILRNRPYIVLMYSKDATARTTKKDTSYNDVVSTIKKFLTKRINFAIHAGFPKNKIIIDPGMGAFVSNDPKYSFEIINRLAEFKDLRCPILIGISRKLFKGTTTERDTASAKWSLTAIQNGASLIRVHDVNRITNPSQTQKPPQG